MRAILVYYADCEIHPKSAHKFLHTLARNDYAIWVYGSKDFITNADDTKDTLAKFLARNHWIKNIPAEYKTYEEFDKSMVVIDVDDYDVIDEAGETEIIKEGGAVPRFITNNYFRLAELKFNL